MNIKLNNRYINELLEKNGYIRQLEDLSQIKKTRKKIARLKTLLTEVEASLNS